jgi:hypothetical protein
MKLSTAKSYFEDFHKDGEADKFIDLFPVDKYRTDNISIPLFKFDYSAFPVQSSHISYFDKNIKNPKAFRKSNKLLISYKHFNFIILKKHNFKENIQFMYVSLFYLG